MRAQLGGVAMLAAGTLLLVGCGDAATSPASSATTTAMSSTAPSSTSRAPGPTGESSTAGSATSAGDRTYRGTIMGSGLTCVGFTSSDGHRYALTGQGVTSKVRSLAHSGFQHGSSGSLSAQQTAQVTVVGHIVRKAMNPCGFTTLVTSQITVHSVRSGAGPATK